MRASPTTFSRQHRIALVGHGGRAFLAGGEIFLRLQNFGALQMADFRRQSFQRSGHHAKRREIGRMAVARNHLGGDRLDLQPQLLARHGLPPRGSILAKVPTAPEIAQVEISSRAVTSRARARAGIRRKSRQASGRRSWARHGCRGCARWWACICVRSARFFSAASSRSTSAISRSAARRSCTAEQVSSTSDEVMP